MLNNKESNNIQNHILKNINSIFHHDNCIFFKNNNKANTIQQINIQNNYNKEKINNNNLTLDLSHEDINNIIINDNINFDKSSIKFNYEEMNSSIHNKELKSNEINNIISPSINIDEESKSYIKDLIDTCKDNEKNCKKYNLKKLIFKNNNENNGNDNNHIKRLKTEDLMEIARRRKKFSYQNNHNLEDNSVKIINIQTEHKKKINHENNNMDNDINELNKNKNKTNRINIKEDYFINLIKCNSKYTLKSKKISNNNVIKNHLFYLYKNKAKNNNIKKNMII